MGAGQLGEGEGEGEMSLEVVEELTGILVSHDSHGVECRGHRGHRGVCPLTQDGVGDGSGIEQCCSWARPAGDSHRPLYRQSVLLLFEYNT